MRGGLFAAKDAKVPAESIAKLRQKFGTMMKALYKEEGATLRIDIVQEKDMKDFIDAHAGILDSSFETANMSEGMRRSLQKSDWIFSGMKTFHELNEAFPSIVDEDGNRKPFERFLNDVQTIDKTYNENYLHTEYNFAGASAEMASKWERFDDGDDYLLQYRTAGDDKVRPEHAALDGVTLPKDDPFWDIYYPPNGWNCRCNVVEVLRDKAEITGRDEAIARGDSALAGDTNGMFRFNPGKQGKAFPDYNPYTISRCKSCDLSKGKMNLSKPLNSDQCKACRLIRRQADDEYSVIPTDKGIVRISRNQAKNEKEENIRIATYLANKYNYQIDLLPRSNDKKRADSFNLTLGYTQEYKSNTKPTKNSIDGLIRVGKSQSNSIVLEINSDISLAALSSALNDRVKRCPDLKDVTIIRQGKDTNFSREEMIHNDYKIQPEDFK